MHGLTGLNDPLWNLKLHWLSSSIDSWSPQATLRPWTALVAKCSSSIAETVIGDLRPNQDLCFGVFVAKHHLFRSWSRCRKLAPRGHLPKKSRQSIQGCTTSVQQDDQSEISSCA